MSLQVWLPLNGNLDNLGICDTIKTTSAPEYVTGKLGRAVSLNKAIYFTGLPKLTQFSIFFWAKVDKCTLDWADLVYFECKQADDINASGFRFEATINTRACSFHNNSPYGITAGYRILIKNYSEWHHVGVTYDGKKVYSYIDGELTYTDTGLGGYLIDSFHIGETGKFTGALNDLRIYDNCLSKIEVKEISKTLIAHYPLNSGYGNENLIIESNKLSSWTTDGCSKSEYIDNQMGNCLKIISTGGNNRIYRTVNNVWINKNETFTVSFWAKSNEVDTKITASRSLIDYTKTFILTQHWQKYIGQITTTSTATDGTLSLQITSANKTIYIKDVKLEKGIINTPWCPNPNDILYTALGYNSNIEYDTSGYGNNGTKYNNPISVGNSAIGNSCLSFNGTNQYIALGRNCMVRDEITVNLWGYMENWSNFNSPQMRLISCTEGGGWNFEPKSGGLNFAVGVGETSNTYTDAFSSQTINLSKVSSGWHMITGTFDGINKKIYLDGVLKGTISLTEKKPIFYNANNGIFIAAEAGGHITNPDGDYFKGNISDVRIYATALSDEDIKQLYETKMKIDKEGNLYCNQFIELRENSFYFNLENMQETTNNILEVVDCTAKSIRLKFKQKPFPWVQKSFPLDTFLGDGKTYIIYIKPNENCNKNLEDGANNQYGRTYGLIGIHKYKNLDNTVVKAEWNLKELKMYKGEFTVDFSTYKNYQLKLYPNCTDTTSWNNGDYIYDYIDIVPKEENYKTNISKKSCLNTGEFLENNIENVGLEKYNRTKTNQIIEI